jgi:hypothetical protein
MHDPADRSQRGRAPRLRLPAIMLAEHMASADEDGHLRRAQPAPGGVPPMTYGTQGLHGTG